MSSSQRCLQSPCLDGKSPLLTVWGDVQCSSVVLVQAFAIVGLRRELGYVTRAAMWFGLWFPIMSKPLAWAYEARDWQKHSMRSSQVVRWSDGFIVVHEVLWRILLTFLLYTMIGLIKAALGKYMSFHFHYRNHSTKMQARLSLQYTCLVPALCPGQYVVQVCRTSLILSRREFASAHHANSSDDKGKRLPTGQNSTNVVSVRCKT